MKFIFITTLIITLCNYTSCSQIPDSLKNRYDNNSIYRSGLKFKKGNDKLTFHDLANEFTSSETQQLYFRSKKTATVATICNLASLGLAVFSTLSSSKQSTTISLAIGSGLFGLAGIIFHTRSGKFLDKALWIHNKETLFNPNHL